MRLYKDNNFVDVNEANPRRIAEFKSKGWTETVEIFSEIQDSVKVTEPVSTEVQETAKIPAKRGPKAST